MKKLKILILFIFLLLSSCNYKIVPMEDFYKEISINYEKNQNNYSKNDYREMIVNIKENYPIWNVKYILDPLSKEFSYKIEKMEIDVTLKVNHYPHTYEYNTLYDAHIIDISIDGNKEIDDKIKELIINQYNYYYNQLEVFNLEYNMAKGSLFEIVNEATNYYCYKGKYKGIFYSQYSDHPFIYENNSLSDDKHNPLIKKYLKINEFYKDATFTVSPLSIQKEKDNVYEYIEINDLSLITKKERKYYSSDFNINDEVYSYISYEYLKV